MVLLAKKKKVKEKKIQYGMDSSNMPTNDKMKLGNGSRGYHWGHVP